MLVCGSIAEQILLADAPQTQAQQETKEPGFFRRHWKAFLLGGTVAGCGVGLSCHLAAKASGWSVRNTYRYGYDDSGNFCPCDLRVMTFSSGIRKNQVRIILNVQHPDGSQGFPPPWPKNGTVEDFLRDYGGQELVEICKASRQYGSSTGWGSAEGKRRVCWIARCKRGHRNYTIEVCTDL